MDNRNSLIDSLFAFFVMVNIMIVLLLLEFVGYLGCVKTSTNE